MRNWSLKEIFSVNLNLLPSAVYDALPAVLFGRVLVIATKLGVFEELHRHPQTVNQLATALRLPKNSIELMLHSLKAEKYLKKRDDKFLLAPQAKKWLVKSSPHYLGNFLRYVELLQSHWMYLEDTLRQGKPAKTYVEIFNHKEWQVYILGMMDLAKLILPHLLSKLVIPDRAKALLDIGGSHGLYAIELCKRCPELQATIVDFPQVLETTRKIVREHNVEQRITLLPADVLQATLEPETYDVVLAFNIIHGFPSEMNQKFFQKISSTLRHGGVLYILDQLKNERSSGVERMLPLMVGVNLLNEIGGNVYTLDEIHEWCSTAGLSMLKHSRLSLPGVSLVSARKI